MTNNTRRRRRWRLDIGGSQALYLVLGVVIGILLETLLETVVPDGLGDLLRDLLPEAVGIIFTVLILDRLSAWRDQRTLREQLARRAQSRYNHTALDAIEELRVLGWLEDGALAERNMRGSHWQNGNLYRADLRDTDLTNAILIGADFVLANLEGAQVSDAQLAKTHTMYGCTLPDGSRYDGRYNLPGDFDYARRQNINTGSVEDMAAWYGVTLDQYQTMQQWASRHLEGLKRQTSPTEQTADTRTNRA